MRKVVIYLLLMTSTCTVAAQELFCNVQINSSQVQTSDRRVFGTMQTAVYEFINNTKWTNANIQNEERIECSILININKNLAEGC